MSTVAKGTTYIDMAEFWEFVNEKVDIPEGAEVIFGKPTIGNNEMKINFVYSTESDPRNTTLGDDIEREWKQ